MSGCEIARFHASLSSWHKGNEQTFPWRRTRNPWNVLIAEILLSRTQAPQVSNAFEEMVARYPTPVSLASAETEAIRMVLRPLGLIKRADYLKSTATSIVQRFGGEVPEDVESLMELPGVGRYIANAVACFAFGRRLAVVDANVIRVFGRFFGLHSDRSRPRSDPAIWEFAERIIPTTGAREFNLALLDFGILVCRARGPLCVSCPIKGGCLFYGEETNPVE